MNQSTKKPKFSKRITFRISEHSHRLLEQIKDEHGIPKALFVRHVLDETLEKFKELST